MKITGKGGIFAAYETFPYYPKGGLLGQIKEESCAAAVCRMILQDEDIEIPEAYLRSVLETDRTGTDLSQIPKALEIFGAKQKYVFVSLKSLDKLRETSRQFPAVAAVRVDNNVYHVILVDKISGDFVFVRDPLPVGQGKSYKIKTDVFTAAWIQKKTGVGLAIVVL